MTKKSIVPTLHHCGEMRYIDATGKQRCRGCQLKQKQKHYRENQHRLNEQSKKYIREHREELSKKAAERNNRNRDAYIAKRRLYYAQNKERLNVIQNERRTPEYTSWYSMIQRCENPNNASYNRYGKKGVTVHKPWRLSFEEFFKDVGPRPGLDYSLDRYPDRNGNYEPGNVRWATAKEQANNTRSNRDYKSSISDGSPIYIDSNKFVTLKEFSESTGLPLEVCKYRYGISSDKDYILSTHLDNRKYLYHGFVYNLTELAIISGHSYGLISGRINTLGWSARRAVDEPINAIHQRR